MMGAPRAVLQSKRGPLYDPAVLSKVKAMIATMYSPGFDVDKLLDEKCGRYSRGKHTGHLRGWATWQYVAVGGWLKDGPGYMNGHVVRPGRIVGLTIGDDFAGKTYLTVS